MTLSVTNFNFQSSLSGFLSQCGYRAMIPRQLLAKLELPLQRTSHNHILKQRAFLFLHNGVTNTAIEK